MTVMHRPWTANEIETLRALAGKVPPAEIARRIGRTKAATSIKAHELHLSLRRASTSQENANWASSSVLG
jgi:hypothetical protein